MNIFDPKNNLEWRDYLRIILRRKWYFIIPSVVVFALGAYKIMLTQPTYESFCIIQIKPRHVPSTLRRVVPDVMDLQRYINLRDQILSSEYLTILIDRLELGKGKDVKEYVKAIQSSHPDKNSDEIIEYLLVSSLRKMIRVKTPDRDRIRIEATSHSPEYSYRLVNTMTTIFMEKFLERELGSIHHSKKFTEEQLATFKEKLEHAERELEDYQHKNARRKIAQKEVISDKALNRINEAIMVIDLTIEEKNDYLNYLNKLMEDSYDNEYPKNLAIQNIFAEIDAKIDQGAQLLEVYSWKDAEIINVNRIINELRDEIRTEIERFYRLEFPDIEAQTLSLVLEKAVTLVDIEIAQRKKEALIPLMQTSNFNTSSGDYSEVMYARLQREVSVNRRIYDVLQRQFQGIEIEEAMQRADAQGRFMVLESPRIPFEPMSMGYRFIAFLTIIAASGLGLLAVVAREFLDNSIRNVEEAEALFDIPVIGVLPNLDDVPMIKQNKKSSYAIVGGVLFIIAVLVVLYLKQLIPLSL